MVSMHHASDVPFQVAQADEHSMPLARGTCHLPECMRHPLRTASFLLRAAVVLSDDGESAFPAGKSDQPQGPNPIEIEMLANVVRSAYKN